jgi:hypothetical protein
MKYNFTARCRKCNRELKDKIDTDDAFMEGETEVTESNIEFLVNENFACEEDCESSDFEIKSFSK